MNPHWDENADRREPISYWKAQVEFLIKSIPLLIILSTGGLTMFLTLSDVHNDKRYVQITVVDERMAARNIELAAIKSSLTEIVRSQAAIERTQDVRAEQVENIKRNQEELSTALGKAIDNTSRNFEIMNAKMDRLIERRS